jgi:hypothetical protein
MTLKAYNLQIHKYRNSKIPNTETLSTIVQISGDIVTLKTTSLVTLTTLCIQKRVDPPHGTLERKVPPLFSDAGVVGYPVLNKLLLQQLTRVCCCF